MAEGGFLVDPDAGIGKFPGIDLINIWDEWDVLRGRRGVEKEIEEDAPSIHLELEQREQDFRAIREKLEETADDWATRLEIGNMEYQGCWVGIYDDGAIDLDL